MTVITCVLLRGVVTTIRPAIFVRCSDLVWLHHDGNLNVVSGRGPGVGSGTARWLVEDWGSIAVADLLGVLRAVCLTQDPPIVAGSTTTRSIVGGGRLPPRLGLLVSSVGVRVGVGVGHQSAA